MKWLLIIIISLCSFGSFTQDYDGVHIAKRDSIVNFAKQYLGTPYVYGGRSQSGFDCSGFLYHVFRYFNVPVSRTSRSYKDKGEPVKLECANPGDVILFTGTNAAVRQIGHVGIVINNAGGVIDFIHSSSSKNHYGVTVTRYNSSGYVKRFLKVINILK